MVRCPDCGTEFEKNSRSKSNRCLPCRRVWEKAWRAKRRDDGNPVIPAKMPPEYHREYEQRYFQDSENRERRNANMRRYRHCPDLRPRHEARGLVRNAIRDGRIKKAACEICGAFPADAHHDDYSRPLDIRWLCRRHHAEYHAKAEGRAP